MHKIKFTSKKDDFYLALKCRVSEYFTHHNISRHANGEMKLKIFFFLAGMIFSYYLIYHSAGSYLLILISAGLFGCFSFLTALNVAHDAAHGAISSNPRLNAVCLFTLNLIGVNSYIWKIKHLLAHHTFPNVQGTDSDIGESRIGRLVPSARWRWFCRFQHFYIPVLYLFYSAHWVLFKDFVHFRTLRVPNKGDLHHPVKQYLILFAGKIFAVATTFFLPLWFLHLTFWEAAGMFGIIHLGPGVLVALFLVPAHLNSEVAYPVPDEKGFIDSSWAVHQVVTTLDFSTSNKLFNFLLGGFNHHVAHHLFPTICHCHYPKITPIIRQTTSDFKIPYKETNYINVFRSHVRHLKQMGKLNPAPVSVSQQFA